jgi:ribosomal protein S18 acetylase RimI-like enzyme
MTKGQLIELYEKAELFFWSTISFATTHINGVDLFASVVNNRYLNPAIQRAPLTNESIPSTLDSIQAFFKTHHIPWVWIIREGLVPPGVITSHALELLDTSIAMCCELKNPPALNAASRLQIRENNDDLSDWGTCLIKAYGSPTEPEAQYCDAVRTYIEAHQKQTWNGTSFHHFVGYLGDLPVSGLTLSIEDNRARIDDVGTIPEHQHKGFATELVRHALTRAKALGADSCFLESSQKGIKVYENLGFEPLFANMYYGQI